MFQNALKRNAPSKTFSSISSKCLHLKQNTFGSLLRLAQAPKRNVATKTSADKQFDLDKFNLAENEPGENVEEFILLGKIELLEKELELTAVERGLQSTTAIMSVSRAKMEELVHILEKLADLSFQQKKLNRAEEVLTKLKDIKKEIFGTYHPQSIPVIEKIARVYYFKRRYHDCINAYQDMISIIMQALKTEPKSKDFLLTQLVNTHTALRHVAFFYCMFNNIPLNNQELKMLHFEYNNSLKNEDTKESSWYTRPIHELAQYFNDEQKVKISSVILQDKLDKVSKALSDPQAVGVQVNTAQMSAIVSFKLRLLQSLSYLHAYVYPTTDNLKAAAKYMQQGVKIAENAMLEYPDKIEPFKFYAVEFHVEIADTYRKLAIADTTFIDAHCSSAVVLMADEISKIRGNEKAEQQIKLSKALLLLAKQQLKEEDKKTLPLLGNEANNQESLFGNKPKSEKQQKVFEMIKMASSTLEMVCGKDSFQFCQAQCVLAEAYSFTKQYNKAAEVFTELETIFGKHMQDVRYFPFNSADFFSNYFNIPPSIIYYRNSSKHKSHKHKKEKQRMEDKVKQLKKEPCFTSQPNLLLKDVLRSLL